MQITTIGREDLTDLLDKIRQDKDVHPKVKEWLKELIAILLND
jgi:hypothetical protein